MMLLVWAFLEASPGWVGTENTFLGLGRWDLLLKMGTVKDHPPCCPLGKEIVRENSSQLQGLICCPDEEMLIT